MKIKACLVAIGLVAFAAFGQINTALAQGTYLSGSLGLTFTDDAKFKGNGVSGKIKIDDELSLSAALGRGITENIRAEIALSRRDADIKSLHIDGLPLSLGTDGSIKTTALMVNGYYDFMVDETFSPYITAGVGFAQHDINTNVNIMGFSGPFRANGDDRVLAWQFGGGASFDLAENYSLFADYRFFSTRDAKIGGFTVEYEAQELRVGIRYHF